MLRLTIYREGEPVREQVLATAVTALGRHTDNDVVLDDLALSRFHARLEQRDEIYVVVDLGSQNGVYVNGVRITGEQILRAGDRIGMGRYVAVFDQEGARREENTTGSHRSDLPAPQEPEAPAEGPSLMLLFNGTQMERFPLAGQGYVIGRSHRCDIVIGLLGLSRRHARVFFHDAKWRVEDMGSQNGTFINDTRIGEPHVLRDGDVLNFFEYSLVYSNGDKPPVDITAPQVTRPENMRPPSPSTTVDEPPEGFGMAVLGPTEAGTDEHDVDNRGGGATDERELEARDFEAGETDMEESLSDEPNFFRGRPRTKTASNPEALVTDDIEAPSVDSGADWPNDRQIEEALTATTRLAPAGRLEVRLDKRLLTEVPLDRSALRIGSDARCDVALPPLPSVAGWHLVVVRLGAAVLISRVGNAKMPTIGGNPTAQYFLQDGDKVELGRVTLVYRHR